MWRSKLLSSGLTGAVLAAAAATPAAAAAYSVNVYESSVGSQFDATTGSIATVAGKADASTASFTYNGPLSFINNTPNNTSNTGDITSIFFGANASNISGYSGIGPSTVAYGANGANFLTLAGFLGTSGSINGFGYGSLYTFTSGTGNYGGTVLTITHDDGASVYANGALVPGLTAGPTSAITETVVLPTGTTSYELVYGRENGAPSVLSVAVPEPMSFMLLGAGLAGAGLFRRRPTATLAG